MIQIGMEKEYYCMETKRVLIFNYIPRIILELVFQLIVRSFSCKVIKNGFVLQSSMLYSQNLPHFEF